METKELTKDQILDIIHMKAEGHSIAEIMQKYPFIKTRSTIYYHLHKAPLDRQGNSLVMLHKKIDQILQRLQDIEQYLESQNRVQDIHNNTSLSVQDSVQYTKPIKSDPEETHLKISEIVTLCCFVAEGKAPSVRSIQNIFKDAGLKSIDPVKKGYPLKDVVKVLMEKNQKTKARYKLDISELEKLLKDSV